MSLFLVKVKIKLTRNFKIIEMSTTEHYFPEVFFEAREGIKSAFKIIKIEGRISL